jgi:multidrug efflux system outer membrane protein
MDVNLKISGKGSSLLLAGVLFLIFSVIPLPAQSPFTLEQCVDSVVAHSYLYRAGEFRTQAAERDAEISRTYMMPSVTGDAGVEGRFLAPWNFGQAWAVVHGDWSLGDFIKKTDQVARQEVITTRLLQEQTRLDAVSRAVSLYMSIMQQRREVQLLDDRIALLKDHLVVARHLWNAGVRTRMDILQTEAEINRITVDRARVIMTLRNLAQELTTITGMPPRDTLVLEHINAARLIGEMPVAGVSDTLVQHNPLYQVYLSKIKTQQLQTGLVSAQQWPHLTAGAGRFGDGDPGGDGSYWLLNAGIAIPIYQWGRIRQEKKRSEAITYSLSTELLDLSRELQIHLARTVTRMEELQKMLDLQQQRLENAREAWSLASINYKAGILTNLEYLTAQQQVTATEIAIAQTRLQYVMNLIEYYLTTNQVEEIRKMGTYVKK